MNKEAQNNLLKALFNVQKNAPAIDKSTNNPFFKSKYADLADIWAAVRPLLADNSLLISHTMESNDGGDYIRTKVYHVDSGEFIESLSKIMLSKSTAQEYGSYITYMRRYAVTAMLGLITDNDDDGNSASQTPKKQTLSKEAPKAEVKPLSGEEFLMIQNGLKNATLETLESEKAKAKAVWARATKEQRASITKFVADADKRLDDIPHFGGNDE